MGCLRYVKSYLPFMDEEQTEFCINKIVPKILRRNKKSLHSMATDDQEVNLVGLLHFEEDLGRLLHDHLELLPTLRLEAKEAIQEVLRHYEVADTLKDLSEEDQGQIHAYLEKFPMSEGLDVAKRARLSQMIPADILAWEQQGHDLTLRTKRAEDPLNFQLSVMGAAGLRRSKVLQREWLAAMHLENVHLDTLIDMLENWQEGGAYDEEALSWCKDLVRQRLLELQETFTQVAEYLQGYDLKRGEASSETEDDEEPPPNGDDARNDDGEEEPATGSSGPRPPQSEPRPRPGPSGSEPAPKRPRPPAGPPPAPKEKSRGPTIWCGGCGTETDLYLVCNGCGQSLCMKKCGVKGHKCPEELQ